MSTMDAIQHALVVGGSGFLGRRLLAALGSRGTGTWRSQPLAAGLAFDATTERLSDLQDRLPCDLSHVFVPFGAIDMEGCARDPAATSAVNVVAVTRVLDDCFRLGLTPVFVSTDYVFDGTRSLWNETDEARPRMAYGAQKLAVEHWLGTRREPHIIARLSKVVSEDTDTHSMIGQWVNEIKAGKAQTCADDQYFSPAHVDDLARALVGLADAGTPGLFHVAGPERFSRLGLLELLAREVTARDPRASVPVTPCALHNLYPKPFAEMRPHDTSLATAKLRATIACEFRSMQAVCARAATLHFGG